MTEGILYAYYDLKIFPESYNVVDFLYFAEIERIHLGLDSIEYRVVANDGDGFRSYRTNWLPLDDKKFRLNHIILAAGRLMPSCRRTVYYPTREEAKRDFDPTVPIFPYGYKFEDFNVNYHDSAVTLARYAGKRLGSFRATEAATVRIAQWLTGHAGGRKPVTITLRNYPHEPRRNSDLPEWIRFADSLDADEYCPIFLRDTADVFGPPIKELDRFLTFDPASIDMDLRLALYEKAYLNLFVETGPAQLCILDDVTRCIRFKILQEVHPYANAGYYLYRGYVPGMQWPCCTIFQRSVWDYDKYDVIRDEFDKMVLLIESGIKPSRLPLPPATTMITRFIAGRNHDHAIALASDQLSRDPLNPQLIFLLAKAYDSAGKIQAALGFYEKLLSLPNAFPLVAAPMARCLQLLGKNKESLELVRRIPKETDNIDTLDALADFLYHVGEEELAFAIYKPLAERATDVERIQRAMANCCRYVDPSQRSAIPYFRRALKCAGSNGADNALTIAECVATQNDFPAAIAFLKDELQQIESSTEKRLTLTAYLYLGLWLTLLGRADEARIYLTRGIHCVEEHLALHDSQQPNADEYMAIKARLLLVLGDHVGANDSISRMHKVTHYPDLKFSPKRGSIDAKRQIERLKEIVGGRDIFILCHGPSIYEMDAYWERFALYHPSIFAINRFRVFETGFLAQTSASVDAWLTIQNWSIKQDPKAFFDFLGRDEENILITTSRMLGALGYQMPALPELEQRFGHKILYYDANNRLHPSTPQFPLCFIAGATLSHLICYAALASPRRIFIFGADGKIPDDPTALTHYRADSPDFGRSIDDTARTAIGASLASEAKTFNHVAELNLMATETVFRFSRPPIYNVSPDSAIDLFPRISYDEALAMLESGQATDAAASG